MQERAHIQSLPLPFFASMHFGVLLNIMCMHISIIGFYKSQRDQSFTAMYKVVLENSITFSNKIGMLRHQMNNTFFGF